MIEERDIIVAMRDGTRLAVDVYRPDAPGRYPVLYASALHNKDIQGPDIADIFPPQPAHAPLWFGPIEAGDTRRTRPDDERTSDPWVSFGPDGTAYSSVLELDGSDNKTGVSGAVSHDGGQTWTNQQLVESNPTGQVFSVEPSAYGHLVRVRVRVHGSQVRELDILVPAIELERLA